MLLFCIFTSLVVLSNVSCNQNASADDIVHTTRRPLIYDSGILNLTYIQELRNPCPNLNIEAFVALQKNRSGVALEDFFPRTRRIAEEGEREILDVLRHFNHCADLYYSSLPADTLTLAELKEVEEREALNRIYRSLIYHFAHTWIIKHKLSVTLVNCSHNIQVIQEVQDVALKLQALSCGLFIKMNISGYENDDIIPQLREYTSLGCVAPENHVCQVMSSTRSLLQQIQNYAADISPVHNTNHSITSTFSFSSISTETTSYTTLSS